MLMKIITFSVFALWACQTTAHSADCAPLHLLSSVKLEALNNGSSYLVPVNINGTSQKFVLDTGGYTTQISRATVNALGLPEKSTRGEMIDAYGHMSDRAAMVAALDLGKMQWQNRWYQISPHPDLGDGVAGLLSTDLFARYDVDLDFGAGRLNYFSTDHCDGRVSYWPERPLAVIPMTLTGNQITLPVTVDGKEMTAIVDTGATFTVMNADTARKTFGLVAGSPDLPQTGSSSDLPIYHHTFEKLSFEGITVMNPKIGIVPDRMARKDRINDMVLGSRAQHKKQEVLSELIIGMNVLKRLHIYIAYQESKLYVTPAGTGESALFNGVVEPK